MKKLIIAAVIVCAAVISQGASFRWRANGIPTADKQGSYAGSATLYATLFDVGTATEEPVASGSTGGTFASGSINTVVSMGLTTGAIYDFYYTITDANGNVFTSTKVEGVKIQANSTPTLGFGSGGAWAVPEPTSGLLLLLGVAGIALKRKRA